MPAEIYDGGSWKLCLVTSIIHRGAESKAKQPLLKILLMDDDDDNDCTEKVVDVGESIPIRSNFSRDNPS